MLHFQINHKMKILPVVRYDCYGSCIFHQKKTAFSLCGIVRTPTLGENQ